MTIEEATNDLLSESISNHFQHLAKTQDGIVPCSSCGDTSDSYIRKDTLLGAFSMLALPIFPGRLQPSIVGRSELNFRVRDGNGWTLALISTNY